MEMGGQLCVRQFTIGFLIVVILGEPGVYSVDKNCEQPGVGPDEVIGNATNRIRARLSRNIDAFADQLWEEATEPVEVGRLGGPFPFDEEGRLLTSGCPQRVNPASGFGAPQVERLRSADALERRKTNSAVVTHFIPRGSVCNSDQDARRSEARGSLA